MHFKIYVLALWQHMTRSHQQDIWEFILIGLLNLNVRSPKIKLVFIKPSMQFLVRLDDVPQRR